MTETVARCAGMAAPEADAGGAGFILTAAGSGWLNLLRDTMKPRSREAAKPRSREAAKPELRPLPRARLLPN